MCMRCACSQKVSEVFLFNPLWALWCSPCCLKLKTQCELISTPCPCFKALDPPCCTFLIQCWTFPEALSERKQRARKVKRAKWADHHLLILTHCPPRSSVARNTKEVKTSTEQFFPWLQDERSENDQLSLLHESLHLNCGPQISHVHSVLCCFLFSIQRKSRIYWKHSFYTK